MKVTKVVWITGGGSGLGRGMALEYAKKGAVVAVSGRRVDRLQQVCQEIERLGATGLAVPCDVLDAESIEAAAATVIDRAGGIDIVIANAGTAISGGVRTLSAADWDLQLGVNVSGVALTIRAALPSVLERNGQLVLISSVAAVVPMMGSAAYQASKAAVSAMGQSLRVELVGSNVTVTTIHPGFVESEIGRVDKAGHFNEQRVDRRPSKLMWRIEPAARVMVRAIERKKSSFVFTGHGLLASFIGRHFPNFMVWIMKLVAKRMRAI